ncbi:ATP-binding protein [Fulvivirga sp. M361]|uniref:ATP-binding protein n=1 Tax=Fulvivirga sp. M361 TaxID=2594266 RepID=UPI001179D9B8|nr:ATP-binding protein [Fulvivirga sp. M361]TRX49639.1 ATP-binding protein [Fulvivirga sp. M361]
MKEKVQEISAIPSKRIYLSIIADYHLHLSICELIDNAIDNWIFNGRKKNLKVNIDLNYEQQTIAVIDNSGGIKEEDIGLIVGPGKSRSSKEDEIIGVFGVGSKRAVVAMAKDIKIVSRYLDKKTLMIEIDDAWIGEEDNWDIDTFEVDPIEEGSTKIGLSILREKIEESKHEELIQRLGETYAMFLENGNIDIQVNEDLVSPTIFNNWSYPPDFEPRESAGKIKIKGRKEIEVSITGGLTKSHKISDSDGEEYGMYFYCNDRLIIKAYKGDEIGFNKPFKIGKPHPTYSIARVIVKLKGEVDLMPWNSSKSQVDFKHKTFLEIQEHIERMFLAYAVTAKSASAAGGWDEEVFKYSTGSVRRESLNDISKSVRIHVPVIKRRSRTLKYIDLIKRNNKELNVSKPWVVGLYEAVIAVNEISKLNLEQNNRISLLVLDSTLEIAFKEFLLNETGSRYSESRIANLNRVDLQGEVKNNCRIKKEAWKIIDYYYLKRCDLVHKRSTTQISNDELNNYREYVEYTLTKMFNLNFSKE